MVTTLYRIHMLTTNTTNNLCQMECIIFPQYSYQNVNPEYVPTYDYNLTDIIVLIKTMLCTISSFLSAQSLRTNYKLKQLNNVLSENTCKYM